MSNNCKIVKARKAYKCDCCNHSINVGDSYLRINIKNSGIFRFCNSCTDDEDFIETKINNPEVSYDEYKAWMEEATCWNNCWR